MADILHEIAEYTRERIKAEKALVSPDEMREMAEAIASAEASAPDVFVSAGSTESSEPDACISAGSTESSEPDACTSAGGAGRSRAFPFERALASPGMSFICECKKASPSKGLIAPDFRYLEIAKSYEDAGASAISVLTEPKWFLGKDEYLKEISGSTSVPCLRKDFVVDSYMIYQAKVLGASAVLLIVSILSEGNLAEYIRTADSVGLSALVEAHDPSEIKTALACGARIIGVNNRNLKDFTVDTGNALTLRRLVPEDVLFVAESGISSREDVATMEEAGVDAVLVGEALMRADDRKAKLAELRGVELTNAAADEEPDDAADEEPDEAADEEPDNAADEETTAAVTPGKACGAEDRSDEPCGLTRVKICGLRRPEDIEYANEAMPDYVGFIFDSTRRRFIDPGKAAELKKQLSPGIRAVGVFVDAEPEYVIAAAKSGAVDLIQLHGSEDNRYIEAVREKTGGRFPIIKAFTIRSEDDVDRVNESAADMVLLDNGTGTGERFDWTILKGREINKKFFLAGGLSRENVGEAIRRFRPYAVDASSTLETDGYKDLKKMKTFVQEVRKAAQER